MIRERLPRYEMVVDCAPYCYGGTPKPERADEEYPEYHDWSDPSE